jgi:hypothetical protein
MRHQTEMTMRIPKITLIALLALAATSVDAHAGQYHVYSCRTPSGQSAPVDGWSGSTTGVGAVMKNTCDQPTGGLLAALLDQMRTANTDGALWSFSAPPQTALVGATLWRAGDADGGTAINARYEFWFAGPHNFNDPADAFGQCASGSPCSAGVGSAAQPLSAENRLSVPARNLGTHLYVNASCVGQPEYSCKEGEHDANGYAVAVSVLAADLTLEQNLGPSVANVSGELAIGSTLTGTSDVAFSATDPGSGIYEAIFSVDGQLAQSTVLNENGGRCRNAGQTTDGLPAFLYVQPCLASVSADVGFDTTKVSDGAHHLVVNVIDAAGNAAPVLDRTITVANAGLPSTLGPASGANGSRGANGANGANGTNGASGPNGSSASSDATLTAHWQGSMSARLTSAYGRTQTIVGRLTGPAGVPIAGAQVDLVATPAYAGAKPTTMTSPATAPDGSFIVRLSNGVSSRTLRFAYRSHLGDTVPVAVRTLTLSVRAGVVLSVTPRSATVGRSVVFRGRLLGGSIPRGGKQLVLEARSRSGPWLEFKVIRANAQSRFRATYRFRFPGPIHYQFRVLSEPEADYPFLAGSSNIVGVRER